MDPKTGETPVDPFLLNGLLVNSVDKDDFSQIPQFNSFFLHAFLKDHNAVGNVLRNLLKRGFFQDDDAGKNAEIFHALFMWMKMFSLTFEEYDLDQEDNPLESESRLIPSSRIQPTAQPAPVSLAKFYPFFQVLRPKLESGVHEEIMIPPSPGVVRSLVPLEWLRGNRLEDGDLFLPEKKNFPGLDMLLRTGDFIHCIEVKYSYPSSSTEFSIEEAAKKLILIEKHLSP